MAAIQAGDYGGMLRAVGGLSGDDDESMGDEDEEGEEGEVRPAWPDCCLAFVRA